MILLDTNVVSELMRPRPSELVVAWLATAPRPEVFTTTITQAEILVGIALLNEGRRRTALQERAADMFAEDFSGRILPFDGPAAETYAAIVVERTRTGRPIAQLDAQIAAVGRARGASVATRNVSDFEGCGIAVVDPWAFGGRTPRTAPAS